MEEVKGDVVCPPQMAAEDFAKLQELVTRHRGDPFLSLLPMPAVAHGALGIPKPGVASLMDTAWNCLMKTSTHEYTTTEVEVRDLSKTLTADAFPKFYEGPSHPHMLPEGGVRVIAHETPASETTTAVASAASGAGAGAGMTDE